MTLLTRLCLFGSNLKALEGRLIETCAQFRQRSSLTLTAVAGRGGRAGIALSAAALFSLRGRRWGLWSLSFECVFSPALVSLTCRYSFPIPPKTMPTPASFLANFADCTDHTILRPSRLRLSLYLQF